MTTDVLIDQIKDRIDTSGNIRYDVIYAIIRLCRFVVSTLLGYIIFAIAVIVSIIIALELMYLAFPGFRFIMISEIRTSSIFSN